jgi:hypothetical protein
MASMIAQFVSILALVVNVLFDGQIHEFTVGPWQGRTEIFDTLDGDMTVNASHTSGDSMRPMARVCGGRLFLVYEDTTNIFGELPSIRWGEYTAPFWSSQQVPNAYGWWPGLSCLAGTLVLSYRDPDPSLSGNWRLWYQVLGTDGWSLPSTTLLLPRAYVPLGLRPGGNVPLAVAEPAPALSARSLAIVSPLPAPTRSPVQPCKPRTGKGERCIRAWLPLVAQ